MDILTKTRRKVLDAVVGATEATGVCPTLGMVCRHVARPRTTVRNAVDWLERHDYVSWSSEHGAPIRPLVTADGLRIEIRVMRVHQ